MSDNQQAPLEGSEPLSMAEAVEKMKAEPATDDQPDSQPAEIQAETAESEPANEPEPETEERETKEDNGPSEFNVERRRISGSKFDDGGEFLYATWLASTAQKRDPRLVYFRDKEENQGYKLEVVKEESVNPDGTVNLE